MRLHVHTYSQYHQITANYSTKQPKSGWLKKLPLKLAIPQIANLYNITIYLFDVASRTFHHHVNNTQLRMKVENSGS